MTTNVPAPLFGPTGFIAPTEGAILAGAQADINAAFGGNLNPGLTTPQGQIASSLAAIIADVNDTFTLYTNLVDPAYSFGRMQDAIARIYYLTRNPALPTVLQVQCMGGLGVVIPVGSLIRDSAGNVYTCSQSGTIGLSGTVALPFASATPAPGFVPSANSMSIYQLIPGWDSIVVLSGLVGRNVESAADFERRRQDSVEGNSFGAIASIIGAVAKVPGVLDYYGYDNSTNASVTVGGQVIAANSIYICVAGGTATTVASAILSKKGAGCSYTGNTTVTAYDTNPLYAAPIPYQVTFQTPAALPIVFSVVIKNSPRVPFNALALIQAAIATAFSGADGGPAARIGSTIFASRFYANIAALGPWAQIVSVQIGSADTPSAVFTGSIAGNTLTVTSTASGAVAVGQTIEGAGVAGGTVITVASGSGVYTVSIAQTVSSESMTAFVPTLNSLTVQTNQIPTLNGADIALALI